MKSKLLLRLLNTKLSCDDLNGLFDPIAVVNRLQVRQAKPSDWLTASDWVSFVSLFEHKSFCIISKKQLSFAFWYFSEIMLINRLAFPFLLLHLLFTFGWTNQRMHSSIHSLHEARRRMFTWPAVSLCFFFCAASVAVVWYNYFIIDSILTLLWFYTEITMTKWHLINFRIGKKRRTTHQKWRWLFYFSYYFLL